MTQDIVDLLREESTRLSGHSLDRGCADSGIAANVADEAVDQIERLRADYAALVQQTIEQEAKLSSVLADGKPVAWTIVFNDWYGVNAETTFKTKEKAELYVKACGRGIVTPVYLHPPTAALSRERDAIRNEAFEEAANFLKKALIAEQDSDESEAAGDVFNAAYRRPMAERLAALGEHLASSIRALKSKGKPLRSIGEPDA